MSRTDAQKLGTRGEHLACQFLIEKGHKIIVRNFRAGRSELDIISRVDNTIVVSEVKSFYSNPLGAAEYRVHKAKQRQIIQGTWAFLGRHPEYEGFNVRFDVLIVDMSAFPAKITHYEGAFWQESW